MGPIFLWSIHRFGILSLVQDKWLRSPIFYADSSKVARFCLGLRGVGFPLNPNGHAAKLFLCRCDTDGPENVEVEYTISLDRRSSTYKRRFLKPQKDAYQSYETDALPLSAGDISESDIKAVCTILSYDDDDKYTSSDLIDRTDFESLSHDLSQMFFRSEFSDAVIRIQDHEFNVHKAVLGVRCPALLRKCQVKNLQKTTQKCYHWTKMLLYYIYGSLFLSREISDDLHFLLKKCNDSIFEHLFPYYPIELHTRTSFEDNRVCIKWDIETFLKCIQNKEYRYIITEGQPSTWLSITFLEDEAEYIEFVVHKMCKKTIAFVHCEILIHPSTNSEVDVTTIFRGNHLFIDDQPWKVKLDHTLRTIRKVGKAEPRYLSILFNVTDVKPTNSVEKVRYSYISSSHIHSVGKAFQLSRDMETLYKNPIHSDVTLIIKDKRIPGHKAILSARSLRFYKILLQNTFQTEIPINDLDEKVALSMIYYIYSAQVLELDTDLALELHKAADLYRIDILKRKCSRYLERSLTAANVGEILLFADAQNDSELKCSVYNFIKTHPSDVSESKQSMGIMRSYHYLHLDALKDIYKHLAEKVRKKDIQKL